jgi:hypothetical protein
MAEELLILPAEERRMNTLLKPALRATRVGPMVALRCE